MFTHTSTCTDPSSDKNMQGQTLTDMLTINKGSCINTSDNYALTSASRNINIGIIMEIFIYY